MFKVLGKAVLDVLLFLGSFLVPKQRGLMVFGASLGQAFCGSPKYVYLHLLEHPGAFAPCWITGCRRVEESLRITDRPVVNKYSLKGFWTILRAELFIIDHGPSDIFYLEVSTRGRFRIIQTAHGMPLKKGGQVALEEGRGRQLGFRFKSFNQAFQWLKVQMVHKVLQGNYEVCLAMSEESRKDIGDLYHNAHVEVLGVPRNDALFEPEIREVDYRVTLGLDAFETTILYVPTFRDGYGVVKPFSDGFLETLNEHLAERNSVLLIKAHPLEARLEVPAGLSNIRDVREEVEDLMELYPCVDVLITDYSSVVFEFPLLDRPMILFPYDIDEYLEHCRGMIYDYWETLPGPFARSEQELIDLVDQVDAWFEEPCYRRQYQAFTKRFNSYLGGGSCARLLEYLAR